MLSIYSECLAVPTVIAVQSDCIISCLLHLQEILVVLLLVSLVKFECSKRVCCVLKIFMKVMCKFLGDKSEYSINVRPSSLSKGTISGDGYDLHVTYM